MQLKSMDTAPQHHDQQCVVIYQSSVQIQCYRTLY